MEFLKGLIFKMISMGVKISFRQNKMIFPQIQIK